MRAWKSGLTARVMSEIALCIVSHAPAPQFKQLGPVIVHGAAPGFNEENRLISSRAVAKICFQPVDETFAIMDITRLDSPLEAV